MNNQTVIRVMMIIIYTICILCEIKLCYTYNIICDKITKYIDLNNLYNYSYIDNINIIYN